MRKKPYPPMPLEGRFPLWPEHRPKLGEDGRISSLLSTLNRGPAHKHSSWGPSSLSLLVSAAPWTSPKPCLKLGLREGVFSGHISKGLGRTFIRVPFQTDPRITVTDLVKTVLTTWSNSSSWQKCFAQDDPRVSGWEVLRAGHLAWGTSEASPGPSVALESRKN